MKSIVNAISAAIYSNFGSNYTIYGDNSVKQGTDAPCFFVSLKECSQKPLINNRILRTFCFDIRYIPKNENNYTEMQEIANLLYNTLEFVELDAGNKVYGSDMNYEFIDGILHFYVKYELTMQRQKKAENMGNLFYQNNNVYISELF